METLNGLARVGPGFVESRNYPGESIKRHDALCVDLHNARDDAPHRTAA